MSRNPRSGDRLAIIAGPWNDRSESCTDQEGTELRVSGLIPGETATIEITRRSRGGPVAWGVVRAVAAGPERRTAPCPLEGTCGGCGLQHVTPEARLALLVRARVGLLPEPLAIRLAPRNEWIRSPDRDWRHKSILLPSWRGGLHLGAFSRGTHDVVDQPKCLVLAPALRKARELLKGALEPAVLAGLPLTPPGVLASRGLRALVLRANRSGDVLATAVVRSDADIAAVAPILASLVTARALKGAAIQVFGGEGDAVHGRTPPVVLAGASRLEERIAGVPLTVLPLAFFQVNPGVLEGIVERLRHLVGPARSLLDAYCGVGALGLAVAAGLPDPPAVQGCDIVESGILAARETAKRLGVRGTWWVGPPRREGISPAEIAIVDPPRKGCTASELDAVLATTPRRLVYVSCSPRSLARDAERILARGYEAVGLWPADMLPQTAHLELIAAFDLV